jgi:hypothetical protein
MKNLWMNGEYITPMALVLCVLGFFAIILLLVNAGSIGQWAKLTGTKLINAVTIFFTL